MHKKALRGPEGCIVTLPHLWGSTREAGEGGAAAKAASKSASLRSAPSTTL